MNRILWFKPKNFDCACFHSAGFSSLPTCVESLVHVFFCALVSFHYLLSFVNAGLT